MSTQPPQSPYISLNTFTAVEGGLAALIAFQIAETQDMSADARRHGWLGNELYSAAEENTLIIITRFRSAEARRSWSETERFQRHMVDLSPFVASITSLPVAFVRAQGQPL